MADRNNLERPVDKYLLEKAVRTMEKTDAFKINYDYFKNKIQDTPRIIAGYTDELIKHLKIYGSGVSNLSHVMKEEPTKPTTMTLKDVTDTQWDDFYHWFAINHHTDVDQLKERRKELIGHIVSNSKFAYDNILFSETVRMYSAVNKEMVNLNKNFVFRSDGTTYCY